MSNLSSCFHRSKRITTFLCFSYSTLLTILSVLKMLLNRSLRRSRYIWFMDQARISNGCALRISSKACLESFGLGFAFHGSLPFVYAVWSLDSGMMRSIVPSAGLGNGLVGGGLSR